MTDMTTAAPAATQIQRLSVGECKARLDSAGWKFVAKVGPDYRFEKKPAKGRAPLKKFAALKLADLRMAAQVPAMPESARLAAF